MPSCKALCKFCIWISAIKVIYYSPAPSFWRLRLDKHQPKMAEMLFLKTLFSKALGKENEFPTLICTIYASPGSFSVNVYHTFLVYRLLRAHCSVCLKLTHCCSVSACSLEERGVEPETSHLRANCLPPERCHHPVVLGRITTHF